MTWMLHTRNSKDRSTSEKISWKTNRQKGNHRKEFHSLEWFDSCSFLYGIRNSEEPRTLVHIKESCTTYSHMNRAHERRFLRNPFFCLIFSYTQRIFWETIAIHYFWPLGKNKIRMRTTSKWKPRISGSQSLRFCSHKDRQGGNGFFIPVQTGKNNEHKNNFKEELQVVRTNGVYWPISWAASSWVACPISFGNIVMLYGRSWQAFIRIGSHLGVSAYGSSKPRCI